MLELLERQERLTVNQWKLVSAAILGGALGLLALYSASFALGLASASRHLTHGESALIHQSTGAGTVIGAIFWGWMADRIGRRKAFIATVLNVSLASGIMTLTPDEGGAIFLTVFFLFAGLGSAGLFVTLLPLVQEFVPASKRGRIGGLVIAVISLGMLAFLAEARLAVRIDWHTLFVLGLLPALVTLLIRAWVPESPRWLIRNRRLEDARRSLAWALRMDPNEIDLPAALPKMPRTPWPELFKYRRSVVIACVISLAQIEGAGVVALGTGVFVSFLKISWATAGYLTLGVAMAGLAGQFVMSYLSDAIGRRNSGMLCGFGAAVSLGLAGCFDEAFFVTVSVFWLLVMVTSFFAIGSTAIGRPYTAEVWPAGLRASGMGLAYAFGLLGGLLAPLAIELISGVPSFLTPQAIPHSVWPATLFLAAFYALSGLVFWLLAIETRGRTIEEIDATLAIAASRP